MANIKTSIGYSPLSDKVYLGKQNQDKGMWVGEKKDVTSDFIAVSLAYYEENTIREIGGAEVPNLVINIKKDKASIERTIKALEKQLTKLS